MTSFADKAAQLHSATSKKEGNTIRWTIALQDSFKVLQGRCLRDRHWSGIGAAEGGGDFPSAWLSTVGNSLLWRADMHSCGEQICTPVESRYAATELEALAIIDHFEIYLKGASRLTTRHWSSSRR